MLRKKICVNLRNLWTIFFFIFAAAVCAQEEAPSPPAAKTGVKLQFIPPPMEGTFALGIYDAHGKLVRTLHTDAETSVFGVALNGLITWWDGQDDHGAPMPAGPYSARGFCVGEIDVEGEADLGNDFVTDEDSPHLCRIHYLGILENDDLLLRGVLADGQPVQARCNFSGEIRSFPLSGEQDAKVQSAIAATSPPASLEAIPGGPVPWEKFHTAPVVVSKTASGENEPEETAASPPVHGIRPSLPGVENVIDSCTGMNGSIWVIDQTATGREVKQYSKALEFQRRLAIAADQPQPQKIAAAQKSDTLFLLEQNPRSQKVRGLALAETKPAAAGAAVSTWKTLFDKTLIFSDTIEAVKDLLKMPDGKAFSPEEKVKLTLAKNPLEQKKTGEAEVAVGFDKDGSFLKLADGLPLKQLTDTAHLKWAAIARYPPARRPPLAPSAASAEADSLVLFQSDGAVVEEFKISRLAKMMAFDCGEFDYDPARDK